MTDWLFWQQCHIISEKEDTYLGTLESMQLVGNQPYMKNSFPSLYYKIFMGMIWIINITLHLYV